MPQEPAEAAAAPVVEADVAVPAVALKETPITEANFDEKFDEMFREQPEGDPDPDPDPDPDEKDDPDPDPDPDPDEKGDEDDPDPDAKDDDDDDDDPDPDKDDDGDDPDPDKKDGDDGDDDEKDEKDEEGDEDDDLTKPDSTRKSKSGSEEWVYSKSRGKKLHEGYAKAREAEEALGEELTVEAIQVRDKAFQDRGWMHLDFASGQTKDQAKVFRHFFEVGKEAVENGETSGDPTGNAIDAFMEVAAAEAPDSVTNFRKRLEGPTLASIIRRVYAKAHQDGDENLFTSVANLEKAVFDRFQEFEKYTPPARRADTSVADKAAMDSENAEAAETRTTAFYEGVNDLVGKSVTSEIEGALEPYAKHYQKFPERLKNITVRLRSEIKEAIQQDDKFRQANELLFSTAELAVSDTVIASTREKIAARYGKKSATVVKGLVRKIMSEDADHLKASTDAKKKRLAKQQHKRKNKAQAVVEAKIPKVSDKDTVNKDDWAAMIDAL